jgi:hypothetical protein
VPGQSGNLLQDPHHLTGSSGPTRSARDCSVARHRSRRQVPYAAHDARPPILRGFSPGLRRRRLESPLHKSILFGQDLPDPADNAHGKIMVT